MAVNEIKVVFGGGQKVDAEVHGRVIRTDQPVRDGGEGTAPSPFDLFLASLATCAGYYALAFCIGRGIPTEGLAVSLVTEKETGAKTIGRMTIRLGLPRGFPEKYREAIVKAVDACAVKAHINNPPAFEVVVSPAE
ncbi:MAG TPA: OsmC family protein [Acidobacteriota bacterium]|nr:OsmC family protein [Acidobacteriota bacterium]